MEDLLRQLTPERTKIGDTMLWAIDHAEAADEIIDCIADSLAVLQTPAHKKVIFHDLLNTQTCNCDLDISIIFDIRYTT